MEIPKENWLEEAKEDESEYPGSQLKTKGISRINTDRQTTADEVIYCYGRKQKSKQSPQLHDLLKKNSDGDKISVECMRYFHIRHTVMEMLRDRGYEVSDMELIRPLQDFHLEFGSRPTGENMNIVTAKRAAPNDRMLVFFPELDKEKMSKSLSVTSVKECAATMKEKGTNRSILVAHKALTSFARKAIDEMDKSAAHNIEVFQESELLVNVMKSVLIPAHQVLSNDETKALMEEYCANSKQLPILLRTDPVARYFAMEKGQVVKFVRPGDPLSGPAKSTTTYRIVV